jgi:fumarylpyruvate hydrolase
MPDSQAPAAKQYVIAPPEQAAIAVEGSDKLFPVRRIWCVGRNYADHAREMGHDPDREPPFFFQKPSDAVMPNHSAIPYPPKTNDLQHEIELVVCIGKGGKNIAKDKALDHVFGYCVGLDMTRRDLQTDAKKLGRPWEPGKSFDQSAPVSAVVPASKCGHPFKGDIWVKVNGAVKQKGDLAQHIWQIDETIAFLSDYVAIEAGDIIMMGTPAGVGPVVAGDKVEGHVDGVGDIVVTYTKG